MNGAANCILGVCCPDGSDQQRDALAKEIVKDLACQPDEAIALAKWVLDNFDLAPKGSLVPLKAAIAKLAREPR